jgi:hypothetical protein
VALVLHIGHRNWPMKRSGRHFGVPDRMLFLCPNTRRDNKIAENAGWDRERCWPSSEAISIE